MRRYFFYLFIIFLLYFPVVKLGFSQDDFFFLRMSAVHSLGDVLNFFNPSLQGSFPFYRPLGTQLYFYLFHSALPMHLFMLAIHALSVAQVFRLFVNLGFDKRKSNLVALIYLFASLHFLSLVYIAATQHLLATAFSLLSLNAFFAVTPLLAGIYFACALLSKESAIVLPAIAGLLYLYQSKKFPNLKELLFQFIPYFIPFTLYILLRVFTGVTIQSEYHYVLDRRVFTTLRFYLMFVVGFMESVQDYALPIGLKQYLFDTRPWGYLTLIGSVTSMITLFISVILGKLNLKNLLYGAGVLFLGLALYLGLPGHIFPHYLDYSLLGFLLILAGLKNKYALKVVTLSLIIAGIGGIYSSLRLHWSPTRSRLNKSYIPYLVSHGLCDSSPVIIAGDALTVRNLAYSLSGSNGASVICKQDMDVYFTGVQEDIPAGHIIKVEPL